MNARTTRLLRHAALASRSSQRRLTLAWHRMSWKHRTTYRRELEAMLAQPN